MQNISTFDLIIITITLILGLKGLFRGFIKEVFGILGIIGAIFVASRISTEVGGAIAPILAIQNEATIKLLGFVIALVGFWLVIYIVGSIISKIFAASGLGVIDRIFGFLFGASKIFLIFSVIAYALVQVQSFKKIADEKFHKSLIMNFVKELLLKVSFLYLLTIDLYYKLVLLYLLYESFLAYELRLILLNHN